MNSTWFCIKTKISCHCINFILGLKGYKSKIASTPYEIDIANQLRIDNNKKFDTDLDNEVRIKKLNSYYRKDSIVFLVFYNENAIGSARIIKNHLHSQIFNFYNIEIDNAQKTAEILGLCINKNFRKYGRLAMFSLLSTVFNYSVTHGISNWMAYGNLKLYKIYRDWCTSESTYIIKQKKLEACHKAKRRLTGDYFNQTAKDYICFCFDLKKLPLIRSGIGAFIKHLSSNRLRPSISVSGK